jgi:predicted nucleic acid-binding protein
MTVRYVLDTDHLTLLQRNHPAVITRFNALPPEVIATTVVSAMEQVRGRLAQIHRAKTVPEVVRAFARFQEALTFYRIVPVPAIPAEPSSPMITVSAALAFRTHRCENTPDLNDVIFS